MIISIDESMFVWAILDKIKETKLTFSQGRVAVYNWWQIIKSKQEFSKNLVNRNTIKQIKIYSKTKTGTIVRLR